MTALHHRFIGDNSPRVKSDHVFFSNLTLAAPEILASLTPIINVICERLEAIYKSPTAISFVGIGNLVNNNITSSMQFDDMCLKLWHTGSGQDIYLIMGVRFARTLLIRLLASSLIDDSNAMPLSATEKGIFSFMVARILFDLKNTLNDKTPSLKLLGVFHRQGDTKVFQDIDGFGLANFSLTFASDVYPITMALPKALLGNFNKGGLPKRTISSRGGHLTRLMTFRLKTLTLTKKAFLSLAFGDLMIFDRDRRSIVDRGLQGHIISAWDNMTFRGMLFAQYGMYRFKLINSPEDTAEDGLMEELAISYGKDEAESVDNKKPGSTTLEDLAKNIRVALSIEVARVPMTLSELCKLKEGEIIDLQRKIEDPLAMVVENKVIGHCQPIQIDGRLGIRIVSIESENQHKD